MVDEHFGDSVMLRAKARQGLVVATHPAINTILAAEIGDFNNCANKDTSPEVFGCRLGSPGM